MTKRKEPYQNSVFDEDNIKENGCKAKFIEDFVKSTSEPFSIGLLEEDDLQLVVARMIEADEKLRTTHGEMTTFCFDLDDEAQNSYTKLILNEPYGIPEMPEFEKSKDAPPQRKKVKEE